MKANVRNESVLTGINSSYRFQNGTSVTTRYNSSHNITYVENYDMVEIAGKLVYRAGTNILGIVFISITLGIVLSGMRAKGKDFIAWVSTLNDVIMRLVSAVMWYSPIGIWSLLASQFAAMHDVTGTFESLGLYLGTILTGLIIHSCLFLPLIYFVFTRNNVLKFYKGIFKALLTAFGTGSSSATLPVTLSCLEDNIKIDKRVTRFILPVGATINMDGTALYEAVTAIYIAQATDYDLDFGQYIAISLIAILASIGAAGIPQAGLITMLVVLQTVGLPIGSLTLIISADWFLDRVRTVVNVIGDCIGAGIIAHLSQDDLTKINVLKEFDEHVESLELGMRNQSFVNSFHTLNIHDD